MWAWSCCPPCTPRCPRLSSIGPHHVCAGPLLLESGGSSLFPWPPRCDKGLRHCPHTAQHQGDPGLGISAQESPPTPPLGASYLQLHEHITAPCMGTCTTSPQDEYKVEDATQLSRHLLFKFTVLPRRSLHPLRTPWR